jgi:hypothetical protein
MKRNFMSECMQTNYKLIELLLQVEAQNVHGAHTCRPWDGPPFAKHQTMG